MWFKQPKKDPLLRTPWKESVLFEDAGPNFLYHVFEMSPSVKRHALFHNAIVQPEVLKYIGNDVIGTSTSTSL